MSTNSLLSIQMRTPDQTTTNTYPGKPLNPASYLKDVTRPEGCHPSGTDDRMFLIFQQNFPEIRGY